jgi:phosphoglucosamine mutase
VKKAIALSREKLGQAGRLVIRPSGTEPVIRVMAEADDAALVATIVDEVCAAVAKAAA